MTSPGRKEVVKKTDSWLRWERGKQVIAKPEASTFNLIDWKVADKIITYMSNVTNVLGFVCKRKKTKCLPMLVT